MIDTSMKLSKNFRLIEFLRSSTAERHPELMEQQLNPPSDVVENLTYLCERTLQPIRERLGVPLTITSGYRCLGLNRLIGSSDRSQHRLGQAADVKISDSILNDERYSSSLNAIKDRVQSKTGNAIRENANANYFLFSYICLNLDDLDIDQVIHEYGLGKGQPSWIHVSNSKGGRDKRQIVALGRYLDSGSELPNLMSALNYGTQTA